MSGPPKAPEPVAPAKVPTFSFRKLIVRKALFEQLEELEQSTPDDPTGASATKPTMDLTLQLRLNESEGMVTLGANIRPSPRRHPYRIEVVVAGVFACANGTPEVFDDFARRAVPSILFPYVRQIVHSLTADAAFGPIRLNPINIQHLIAKNWVVQDDGRSAYRSPIDGEQQ